MGKHYTVENVSKDYGTVLEVGFEEPAENDIMVEEASREMDKALMSSEGGKAVFIKGRASLPVAMALGHKVAHLFGSVFCWDPKLEAYVCVITHGGRYRLGEVLNPE